MEIIATETSQYVLSRPLPAPNASNSMSHGFYGLPDGFVRSAEPTDSQYPPMYEAAAGESMLSDMFNFPQQEVLQIPSAGYRFPLAPTWPGKQETQLLPDPSAMRLFSMTPQERAPASPPRQTNPAALLHSASFRSSSSYTGGGGSGGGLSLSLSPNLHQRLESMAKAEMGSSIGSFYEQQVRVGAVNGSAPPQLLRHSKYARAAQELLQEFCSVGRAAQAKGRKRSTPSNPNPNPGHAAAGEGASCSDSKDCAPVLSPSDRFEHQRRKAKLLTMLDEVERRYSRYCEQMQSLVTSFDSVMGFGAAAAYTALAQRAMSRHFRCLKDAVAAQLRRTCELLGEKDCSLSSGITKGETPRLKHVDQSLRQQRAFHQMGMMETEAWRPQRGLPERSVTILRAWLFEHFLHPYPSDSDKHLLARQTGLSRNQVSNWFINARVRLWKPMIEEMYQQEAKDQEEKSTSQSEPSYRSQSPPPTAPPTSHEQPILIPRHHQYQQQLYSSPSSLVNHQLLAMYPSSTNLGNNEVTLAGLDLPGAVELCSFDMPAPDYGVGMVDQEGGRIHFGASGDVSLTLGLRHAGNAPESGRFSVRDFGGL